MYDYVICGAGCAGLSLLTNMIRSGGFSGKKILLLDKGPKTENDRTWCFWEKDPGLFEQIVYRQWDRLWFHGKRYSALKEIGPYRYKMIRSLDFYQFCFSLIGGQSNIDVRYGDVTSMHSDGKETFVLFDGEKIQTHYIFNSIPAGAIDPLPGHHYLLQHFNGWVIKTESDVFDPGEATLMDFRVSQELGTTFVYVMPFSPDTALVEYTLFSETVADRQVYEQGLRNYLQELPGVKPYTILEEEYGIIPMTDHPFAGRRYNIIPIGMRGGRTKPSSGYTFQFIQKQSREITSCLMATGMPFPGPAEFAAIQQRDNAGRYRFYDSVLLNVLATGKLKGEEVFTDLFRRNSITDIFSFLDNESSWLQDFRVIYSLPTMPFLRAAYQQILY